MNNNYFTTKSFTYAIAIQYITGLSYYKFQDSDNRMIYSFKVNDGFKEKIEKLKRIRFS